jgi:hypothetical protein
MCLSGPSQDNGNKEFETENWLDKLETVREIREHGGNTKQ